MTKTRRHGRRADGQGEVSIEEDWDYAFVEASPDGTTWTPVATNLSSPAADDQSGLNPTGAGITGDSRIAAGSYVDLTATCRPAPTPCGSATPPTRRPRARLLDRRHRHRRHRRSARPRPTRAGSSTGSSGPRARSRELHFNAYVAENRQYDGYDTSLKTAYNFGFLNTRPDWVENYPYQNGMLVNYWDTRSPTTTSGTTPAAGSILPVDAHPGFAHSYDGQLWRPRVLSYDSTFGLERTDSITLHKDAIASRIKSQPAVPTFDDTLTWWFNRDEHAATGAHVGRYQPGWNSVNVPKTGTTITVKASANGVHLTVKVAPK